MRYLTIKNTKIAKKIFLSELYRLQLKYLAYNCLCPIWLREQSFLELWNCMNKGSRSLWRTQCLFTNNMKSVVVFFRASRMYFKYLWSQGLLMGIRKSSW